MFSRHPLRRCRLPRSANRRNFAVGTWLRVFGSSEGSSPQPESSRLLVVFAACATAASIQLWSMQDVVSDCEKSAHHNQRQGFTISQVETENLQDLDDALNVDSLPTFSMEQVSRNNGDEGRPIWMSYGGFVYDVTDFVVNHPGGQEKIMTAAGSAVEPFWHLYRQHYATDLPMRLMEHFLIGKLAEEDQDAVDEQLAELEKDDPYGKEPSRHADLKVHSDTPMNAETPAKWLHKHYLTPNALFYIRHHHPVPLLTEKQLRDFRLRINLKEYDETKSKPLSVSLEDLKSMPATTITVTLQCSGNRRSGFNEHKRTSGTSWGQGAVSTATFTGVRLTHLLEKAGMGDPREAMDELGIRHVCFESLDGMKASIGVEKACHPFGDVIVAYEMNGEPLPRDHGFPLRVIVPGYAAVRNVKWLSNISLSREPAEGAWQRGLNYKTLPPSVTDASKVDLAKMPSMTEVSLFSGITSVGPLQIPEGAKEGDKVKCSASGWAWAGGGRNIVRVDVTGDGGETWATASLLKGSDQPFGRAWAWTFWECDSIEAVVVKDGETGKLKVKLASKSVDLAFNVQPESCKHTWNVRGLGNNSWYQMDVPLDFRKKRYSN